MTDIRAAADVLLDLASSQADAMGVPGKISDILMVAWLESIRRGWDETVSGNRHDRQKKAAKELAKAEHDRDDIVCMSYSCPAQVYMIDGKPVVCIEGIMAGAVPIWLHYYRKVLDAVEIAEKVKALSPSGLDGNRHA